MHLIEKNIFTSHSVSLHNLFGGESSKKYKNRYQIIWKCRYSRSVKCSAGIGDNINVDMYLTEIVLWYSWL